MDDIARIEHPNLARRRWMAVLARADATHLDALLAASDTLPDHTIIRGPESGLVMVRGRAGGSGAAFNLGEMTVTRCTVRTETGFIGHAYIAGRDSRGAELAALADALMQDPDRAFEIETLIISPLNDLQVKQKTERSARAAATQVQFFAMQTMRT